MKAFKAFTKPFEEAQQSVKIKIEVNFSLRPRSEREGLIRLTSYFEAFELKGSCNNFRSI